MKIDYDEMAVDYAQHRRIHPGVFMSLLKAASGITSPRLLEVGCGTGNYIIALHEALDCTCEAIDPSSEMLAYARARNTPVHFLPGQAEKLDFPESIFNLVFSVDVIHHVDDRAAYFREASRILKRAGLICTVTDSEDIIRARQPMALYFPEAVEPEVNRYPRIPILYQMMEAAGFKDIHDTQVEHRTTIQDIQAYRDKAFSSLYLQSQEAFEKGIRRMAADLLLGPIPVISRYLLLWGTR